MTMHTRFTPTGIALVALIVFATALIAAGGHAPAAAQDGPTPVPDRAVVPLAVEIVSQYELPADVASVRLAPDGSAYFQLPDGTLARGGPNGVVSLLEHEGIFWYVMGDGSVRIGPRGVLLTPSSFFDEADALFGSGSRGPLIVVGPNGTLYQTGGVSGDLQPLPAVNALLPYIEQENLYKMAAAPNGDLVFAVETAEGIAIVRQGWNPDGTPARNPNSFVFRPEIEDEVIVGLYPASDGSVWIEFEGGDTSYPVIARTGPGEQSTQLLLPAVQQVTPYTEHTGNGIIAVLIGFKADGTVVRAGPGDAAFETWFTADDLQSDSLRWSDPQITGIHTDAYGRLYVHVLNGGALTLVRVNADSTVDAAWNLAEIAPDCTDCAITLAAGPGGELYAYAEGQAGLARLGPGGLVQRFLNDDPRNPVIQGVRVGPSGMVHVATGDINNDGTPDITTFRIGW